VAKKKNFLSHTPITATHLNAVHLYEKSFNHISTQILLRTPKYRVTSDILRLLQFQSQLFYRTTNKLRTSCPNNHRTWWGITKNTTQKHELVQHELRKTEPLSELGNLGQNIVHLNHRRNTTSQFACT